MSAAEKEPTKIRKSPNDLPLDDCVCPTDFRRFPSIERAIALNGGAMIPIDPQHYPF